MKPIFRSTIFALILVICQAFGGYVISPVFKFFGIPFAISLVLGQVIVLVIPTIIYFLITKQSVKEVLRLNPIGIVEVLIIIGIGIFSQPIAAFIGFAANLFFPNLISKVMSQLNAMPLLTKVGIMALTPAICEEITVRGVILSGYKNVSNRTSAIITGLIFGILHMNFQQFFYAFALGVLLAYLVHITNSIFASMICHFTFNSIPTITTTLLLKSSKVQQGANADISSLSSNQKVAMLIGLFIIAIIFSVLVGTLIWALTKIRKNKEMKLTDVNELVYGGEMSVVLSEPKERVLNWPLAAIVVVFVVAQVLRI